MFVLRLAKVNAGVGKQVFHSGKPDGMYISCYNERATKKMRISSSPQKISAIMFNTADEASDFYRDHVVPTQLWHVGKIPVFVVEVETQTKVVIKSVSKDAVRQL